MSLIVDTPIRDQETVEPEPSIFAERHRARYTRYDVAIMFHHRLNGGIPKDPKIMAGWLTAKAGIDDKAEHRHLLLRSLRELGADIDADAEADFDKIVEAADAIADEQHTNGFKTVLGGMGPYIERRCIKAALKAAVNIYYPYQRGRVEWGPTKKTPRDRFSEVVYVKTKYPEYVDAVFIGRGEPDGIHLFVGHPKTPQGTGSTLTYYEYVDYATLEFELEVDGDEITQEQWENIWVTAEQQGLGALRSQGYGTFSVIRFEKIA